MIAADKVDFAMRYPPGHEMAGAPIERETKCSRCERKFTQLRVDKSYLRSVYERSKKSFDAFLSTCERVGKEVWLPARCPHCTRSQLNPDPEYAPMV